MNTKNETTHIHHVEAKGGRRVKGMPYVLGVSLFAAISLVLIVFAVFSA